jgi:hypothetical protein
MLVARKIGILACALLMCALVAPAMGQANGGGGPGGGGQGGGGPGGGGPGGGGRGQFMQQMMDTLKTQLGATDEEFAALQPKIQKIQQAQRDAGANGGGMRGMFGGGGRGGGGPGGGGPGGGGGGGGGGFGGGGGGAPSAVQTAQQDLRTTLDNPAATADEIKAKLDALRQARIKAKADLVAAQVDLKGVLTQRQEAVMVLFGFLD